MNKLEKIKGLTGVLFLFVLAFLAGRFLAKAMDTRSTMAPAVLPAEAAVGALVEGASSALDAA